MPKNPGASLTTGVLQSRAGTCVLFVQFPVAAICFQKAPEFDIEQHTHITHSVSNFVGLLGVSTTCI